MLADKAYSARANRAYPRRRGINLLEQHRAVATRYDKLAIRYHVTINIAAINIRLRHI